jgi:trehalose/maltose hydrolase-like predicted phosphorylase
MSNLTSSYDNQWTILLSNNSNVDINILKDVKGCFIGNGKLGMISSLDKIGVQKSIITTDFDFNETGLYSNNVSDAFNHSTVKFFDNKSGPDTIASMHFNSQSLNMFNGIVTTDFDITNITNSNILNVSYDIYPIRHLPYCTLQSVTVTPNFSSDSNNPHLDIYHEITCGQNISVEDYNNNVIYNELVNQDTGVYMLNGKGILNDCKKGISIASCYVFEQSNFKLIGFNRYKRDYNSCFQKFVLSNFTSGQSYKFHIISTQMTEFDFRLPNEEVKRISVNILNKLQVPEQINIIRQNHVGAWYNMWKSNISIDPKIGITQNETNELNNIMKIVRYSLYNIWSSVREGIRTEVNPSSLSVIDNYGSLFWDGDLWFLPVLILFRPDIARNVLEARYRVIDKAIQLAAGYGYQGSKFPYMNDVTGYVNGPYWDLNGPLHIFNTALVSISVWNYYRVTLDKDWMTNKGYNILKNNANFFVSKITVDEEGNYHLNSVYSFHDKIANDNALTNYLVKIALKFAIEASYELNIVVNENWERTYFNIDLTSYELSQYPTMDWCIIKNDETSVPTDNYKFLEMLIPLVSYYNNTFLTSKPCRNLGTIENNLNFYKSKIQPSFYEHNTMNNMIIAWLGGVLVNYNSGLNPPTTYPDFLNDYIVKIMNENVKGIWGNFNMDNNEADYNDISLSSLFILLLMTSVGTLRITGSVSATRFYNEAMGIGYESMTNMPRTWRRLRLTGIGNKGDSYSILNNVYYQ